MQSEKSLKLFLLLTFISFSLYTVVRAQRNVPVPATNLLLFLADGFSTAELLSDNRHGDDCVFHIKGLN